MLEVMLMFFSYNVLIPEGGINHGPDDQGTNILLTEAANSSATDIVLGS